MTENNDKNLTRILNDGFLDVEKELSRILLEEIEKATKIERKMKSNRKITLTIEDEESGQKVSMNTSEKKLEEEKVYPVVALQHMYKEINEVLDKMESN